MSWLLDLHLLRFFELYLAMLLLISSYLRFRQYRTVVGLVKDFPGRWPRLLELVKQHRNIFLTWGTVLPLVITLGLWLIQTLARQLVWPAADAFTVADLTNIQIALPLVVLFGVAMVGFDARITLSVADIHRLQLEKYFDQAEFWLKSPAARMVHIFTFGYINPRKMVAVEVRSALENTSKLLNTSLWWVSTQAGLRIAFGLSLWGSYLYWLYTR